MTIKITDNGKTISVKSIHAQHTVSENDLIPSWRGDFDSEITVREALAGGTLKVATSGMMRGQLYHD